MGQNRRLQRKDTKKADMVKIFLTWILLEFGECVYKNTFLSGWGKGGERGRIMNIGLGLRINE
jgi:hypothetical protein